MFAALANYWKTFFRIELLLYYCFRRSIALQTASQYCILINTVSGILSDVIMVTSENGYLSYTYMLCPFGVRIRADLHGTTLSHATSLRQTYDTNCFV